MRISYLHKHNFLNSNHQTWRNPTTYNRTSNESFIELYLKAVKLGKVLICASFDYINNKEIELDKVFINTSYITGLDCELQKELKYFEFNNLVTNFWIIKGLLQRGFEVFVTVKNKLMTQDNVAMALC